MRGISSGRYFAASSVHSTERRSPWPPETWRRFCPGGAGRGGEWRKPRNNKGRGEAETKYLSVGVCAGFVAAMVAMAQAPAGGGRGEGRGFRGQERRGRPEAYLD